MDAYAINPLVGLVALQFALHALGWAVGAVLLRDERRELVHWAAFLALVGLGFGLMTGRDEERQWWAFNGAALCWAAGLLVLWRGLSVHFGAPPSTRLQLVLALAALAGHVAVGPGLEAAAGRVVLTYGWMLVVVLTMLTAIFPTVRRDQERWTVVLIASPAAVIGAAFAGVIVRQVLDPSRPIELHRFDPTNLRTMYAYLVAAAIFNLVFMVLVVGRLLGRLRRLSERDALTGLYNRRAIVDRLGEQWAVWQRERAPFSLVLVDLDHFKRVNDTHGHHAGDEVLRHTAAQLGAAVRGHDVVARIGGEEFVVLMPRAGLHEAKALAGRLCKALCETPVNLPGGPLGVTASVGVAQVQAGDADAESVLRRADGALYRAKAAGRARVEAAAA